MQITTRQLEVFTAVAENCSFAEAAARLAISQSAVSNHIANLEDQLGVKLFLRHRGTSPTLSFVGARYLAEVTRFLHSTHLLANSKQSQKQVTLRGYAGSHILECFLKPLLRWFHEENPHIALSFTTEAPAKGVFASLKARTIDFAFFPSAAGEEPAESTVLAELESGIYARRSLSGGKRDNLGLIMPSEGTAEAITVNRQIMGTELADRTVSFVSQYPLVRTELAKDAKGAAPLLWTMVKAFDQEGALEKICDLPPWKLCMALSPRLAGCSRSALSAFSDHVRDKVASLQSEG